MRRTRREARRTSPDSRRRLLFLLAAVGAFFCAPLLGQDDDLPSIRDRLASAERLLALRDDLREWERDGLNARIDMLGPELLRDLNKVVAQRVEAGAVVSPDDGLVPLLDEAAAFALRREGALELRAAEERQTFAKFEQSAAADIARAFMEDLLLMRQQYLGGLAEQVRIRRSAGLEPAAIEERVQSRVSLLVERLTGQIRLDAMSLVELRARLIDKPLDEDLRSAVALVQAKQSSSLAAMEALIDIASDLDIDIAVQRSLLLRERGRVGVEILRKDVFSQLWDDHLESVRDTLVRKGPDVVLRLMLFAVVVFAAWAVARVVRAALRLVVSQRRFRLGRLLGDLLVSVSGGVVFIAGLILAFSLAGVSLGPLLAGIGVLGIIVGLAVQDSLSNFAAGILILTYRPYDVDDHVRVSDTEGLVKNMSLLATMISTFDNRKIVVPNGRIWGNTIVNYTANHVRRIDLRIGVAYNTDLEKLAEILVDLLKSHDSVLPSPEPTVHVAELEDSAIAMMVKPWVRTENYWPTYWDLQARIKSRLQREGIEIPFPQRVVTLVPREEET